MGSIGCPETSEWITTTRCVIAQNAFLICFAAEASNPAGLYFVQMRLFYCVSRTSDFVGDVSGSSVYLYEVSSQLLYAFSVFSHCVKWNLLLSAFSRRCQLSPRFEQAHQTASFEFVALFV
jgi:hypothetical protein